MEYALTIWDLILHLFMTLGKTMLIIILIRLSTTLSNYKARSLIICSILLFSSWCTLSNSEALFNFAFTLK